LINPSYFFQAQKGQGWLGRKKEEGKVVVEITVDSEGNVIEANPNGRGTTTSSALLKAKAKQAALATKFNIEGKFEEQRGTITIIFSFN
jgi:TonB family protein